MERTGEILSTFFDDPIQIFTSMLNDIEKACRYIYIETYKFGNDPIGLKFRNLLTKKARQGVEIKLLIDSWGASVTEVFFKELIREGGEVKFFKKFRYSINLFSVNHERDHRKLLLIDDNITYLSSLNFTNYCLHWREHSLKLQGDITKNFKTVFYENYDLKNTYKFDKKKHTKLIRYPTFEIIRDVPSVIYQRIRKKYIQMIRKAESRIIIESPYFLPTFIMRDALMKATQRGVEVTIIMPKHSDVRMVNILREYYLGKLHLAGIKIYFYKPANLHSKIVISDNYFVVASANFDYRSFRYQFEVALYGNNKDILQKLDAHCEETLSDCEYFNYEKWKKRRFLHKIAERALIPLRHFL